MNDRGNMWLVAEPYVHGMVCGNDALLYNTVSRKALIYRGEPLIAGIINRLLAPENSCAILLSGAELQVPSIRRLLRDLRSRFMAELFDPLWSESRPFNVFPAPIIREGHKSLKDQVREITFHLAASGDPALLPFREAHRQFPFPVYSDPPGSSLETELIRKASSALASVPGVTLHFISDRFPGKEWFEGLGDLFKDPRIRKKIHLPLSAFPGTPPDLPAKRLTLGLIIMFPIDNRSETLLRDLIAGQGRKSDIELTFIVSGEEELVAALDFFSGPMTRRMNIRPFLNGRNPDFFSDNVFLTESDVLASKPTRNQVYSRMLMNEHDFGKLTVMPGGGVYANPNDDPVGNLGNESLQEIAVKAMQPGSGWFRVRAGLSPCGSCIFQFLCPPVSNYEIVAKRYNFCNIWPG